MMQCHGFGSSHQGFVRPTNQDAFLVDNRLHLWAVADGMGGHPGGDVASHLVIDTIARQAVNEVLRLQGPSEQVVMALRDMVESAHHAILAHARQHLDLNGMGTTLTLLQISSHPFPTATIVHEGDSRAYLLRDGTLIQLTRDHSMVEEHVRQGLLSAAQAQHHPQRHVLSRAVGLGPRSDVDVTLESLKAGDRLMLCTDGLTKMVDDARIAITMTTIPNNPEASCRALVAAALDAGGIDNVTVVIVDARH
jgi:protein phosphatase